MTRYGDEARAALQRLYDDPQLDTLADRIDERLDELDEDPGAQHLRRHQLRRPQPGQGSPYWYFEVHGSGQTWRVIWNSDADGEAHVYYVGPEW